MATAGTGTTKQIKRRNMPYRSGRTLGYRMRLRLPLLAQNAQILALEGKADMARQEPFSFWPLADIPCAAIDVAFGGKADMAIALRNVRL